MQHETNLTALAGNLGVSTLRLRAAMEAIGRRAGQRASGDTPIALARELGLPIGKVRAAMTLAMPPRFARAA